MPRIPKIAIHGAPYEICFRLEEGLYLSSSPYMKEVVISYLAMAQTKYPVKICHFMVMANHLHIIVVVENPEHLKMFVGYFKRETAYAINGLLGRDKHNVWEDGYDSPIVLDYEMALSRIAYPRPLS